MPLINVTLIEGVFSEDQKHDIIERLTDAMVSVEGENMREVTWCVVDEVKSMVAFRLGERAAIRLRQDSGGLAADLETRRIDPYRAAEILLKGVAGSNDAGEAAIGERNG